MRRFAYTMMILGVILIMGVILYWIYIEKDLAFCLFIAGIMLFFFGFIGWVGNIG